MSFSCGEESLQALAALGRKLEERGHQRISLLICGGAALNISGLLTRATADVDVLGRADEGPDLQDIPGWLAPCVDEVAHELELEPEWLNNAASAVSGIGLPAGFLQRATRRSFGTRLEIAVASRLDLIALKCLAALDPKLGTKHLGDLVDMNPTSDEMAFATEWLLDRKTSREFRSAVGQLCDALGQTDLAKICRA